MQRLLDEIHDLLKRRERIRALLARDGEMERELGEYFGEPRRRSLDYQAFVIALYGGLERYVEELARSYLDFLSDEAKMPYLQLPEKIRENHRMKSARLIERSGYRRYARLSVDDIIRNLASCVDGALSYRLNRDAFTQHSANFRHSQINSFFAELGINNASTATLAKVSMRQWYASDQEPPLEQLAEVREETVVRMLDDLVDRRNDISHGSWEAEILGSEDLVRRIEFLRAYVQSLYEVVFCHALETVIENAAHCGEFVHELGNPTDTFCKGAVVCLDINGVEIRIGMLIVARTPEGKFLWGDVEELQINDESVEAIAPEKPTNVGVRISFKASKKYRFYILVQ